MSEEEGLASPPSGAALPGPSDPSPTVSASRRVSTDAVWTVLDSYGYAPVEVVRETTFMLFYKNWNHNRTKWIECKTLKAFPWRGNEDAARKLSAKLQSASAEMYRRKTAANIWFNNRVAELTAIVDRNPEGGNAAGGAVHEGAVAKPIANTSQPNPEQTEQ